MGIPFEAAFDAAAPRVEWALKIVVSMPASCSWILIHRAMVELPTARNGLLVLIKRLSALDVSRMWPVDEI